MTMNEQTVFESPKNAPQLDMENHKWIA